jgi:uncharacterized membrane protein
MASTSAGGSAAITLGERSFESISEFDRNSYEHFSLNQKKTVRDRTQDLIVFESTALTTRPQSH